MQYVCGTTVLDLDGMIVVVVYGIRQTCVSVKLYLAFGPLRTLPGGSHVYNPRIPFGKIGYTCFTLLFDVFSFDCVFIEDRNRSSILQGVSFSAQVRAATALQHRPPWNLLENTLVTLVTLVEYKVYRALHEPSLWLSADRGRQLPGACRPAMFQCLCLFVFTVCLTAQERTTQTARQA
jgi:hypothetical protein